MNTELPTALPLPALDQVQVTHPSQTRRNHYFSNFLELLSSMRFAISLLSLIAIASIIGTVLKQNEPMPNYVNQFGPFWFEFFRSLSLYSVYISWWFLMILTFLVSSTSLCLIRNAPKMVKDMLSWRENVREQSLQNFSHKASWDSNLSRTCVLTDRTPAKQRQYQ